MPKIFPPLPMAPIVCPSGAQPGSRVAMKRDHLDVNGPEGPPPEQDTERQTHRRPDCEYVAVFRVR